MADPFLAGNIQRNQDADARKQAMADERRKAVISQYMGTANNLHKSIALHLDPDTMQALPGKEAQVAQMRTQLGQVDDYIRRLYDPRFNPDTGLMSEDPLHKLTDKLHITKAPNSPEQTKTAGEQMADLKGIQQKYATEPSLLTPDEQREGARIKAGIDAKATDKPPKGLKYDKATDEVLDQDSGTRYSRTQANLPANVAQVFKDQAAIPTKATKKSKYDQQREDYAKSIGKTPETMTFKDDVTMMDTLSHSDQRLAMMQKRIDIAEKVFALNQARNDFSQFSAIQKQLSPVEKVQTASANADYDVNNPSGPGDVELVFAFIEATKPTSGFRFTDTERKWIVGTRGLIEGAETRINQGFTGETLSPEQRQNMSGIIKHAASQAEKTANLFLQGASQFSPRAASAAQNQVGDSDVDDIVKALKTPQKKP